MPQGTLGPTSKVLAAMMAVEGSGLESTTPSNERVVYANIQADQPAHKKQSPLNHPPTLQILK